MPDPAPGGPPQPAPGTGNLTGLLCDYGALWDINRTADGYTARRRPRHIPPAVLRADTIPALREQLENGYDPATLTAITRDYGTGWHIGHIDPGSAWAAISRDSGHAEVITAHDLDSLRTSLRRAAPGRQPPAG
jgi:hypothetical protein